MHCIYTSREAHPLSGAEVDALIGHSRQSNARRGISGVLIYAGGWFMQVLEGEPHEIDELYARILLDPRHTRITRIILEAIPRRYFGEWTMGLSQLSSAEVVEAIEGGDAEQREEMLASLDEGRAKKLLRAFTEGRWRQTIHSAGGSPAA